jgi:hypothetical protein
MRYFVVGTHRPYADFRFRHAEIRSSKNGAVPWTLACDAVKALRGSAPDMRIQARFET